MSTAEYWSGHAAEYNDTAAHLTARVARKAFDSCVTRIPAPAPVIIDCACGTGVLTGIIAEHFQHDEAAKIVATDFAQGMVDYVTGLAATNRWAHVDCQLMDAEAMLLPNSVCHAVFCIAGVICMDEGDKAVEEMHRILSPGGLICFSTWKAVAGIPIAMESFKRMQFKPADAPINRPRWGDRTWLEGLMTNLGFAETAIEEFTTDFQVPASGLLDFGHALRNNPAFTQFAQGMSESQLEAWPQAMADAARSLYGEREVYNFENIALIISGKKL